MQHFFQIIGKAIVTGAIAVAGLFGLNHAPVQAPVGATVPIVVATFQTSLQASISSSATSMILVSATDKAGNTLSGYTCFNLDEGTSKEEFVCGTASGVNVTSMIRGISPTDGDLEVTALKKAHARGGSVKVTNYPSLAILSRILNGDETIPNKISYATDPTFTDSKQLASKGYVDASAASGCGNADTTSKGCVEAGTQAEIDAGTQLGGTGARLFASPDLQRGKAYNDYAADSVGTDSYAITITPAISAYATGQIFQFKAGTANTGSATLAVSGLTAKTIKKDVSSDLVTGDILQNQIVTVIYDGTNMQLLSKIPQGIVNGATQISGVVPIANGGTGLATLNYNSGATTGTANASTTVIAHGIGKTPAHIKLTGIAQNSTSTVAMSFGTYDGTNQQSIYYNSTNAPNLDSSHAIVISVTAGSASATGTVTMDATNITITWSNANGGVASKILWEAWGL